MLLKLRLGLRIWLVLLLDAFLTGWQSVHNLAIFSVARIIVGWNPYILSVSLIFCSDQRITLS